MIVCLGAVAQVHHSVSVHKEEQASQDKMQAYMDSLGMAKDSLFTRKMPKNRRGQRLRMSDMRLFMPLTYYGNVAEGLFARDRKENPFLSELMHLYLSRPDLVVGTDRAVQSQQTKLNDIEAPIHHDAKLVEKVVERPVEPKAVPVEVLVMLTSGRSMVITPYSSYRIMCRETGIKVVRATIRHWHHW